MSRRILKVLFFLLISVLTFFLIQNCLDHAREVSHNGDFRVLKRYSPEFLRRGCEIAWIQPKTRPSVIRPRAVTVEGGSRPIVWPTLNDVKMCVQRIRDNNDAVEYERLLRNILEYDPHSIGGNTLDDDHLYFLKRRGVDIAVAEPFYCARTGNFIVFRAVLMDQKISGKLIGVEARSLAVLKQEISPNGEFGFSVEEVIDSGEDAEIMARALIVSY